MKRLLPVLIWAGIALAGAGAYATLAFQRHEPLNSAYILIAALCTYAIGYRFYSKWIAARALALDPRRAPPCEVHDDGKDFVRTNPWIVFGHHFAAISGPGPLVGPVLAAQFGYLPGTLWILIGCVLGGAVQDFVILFCSVRRDGKSLGQMVRDELNGPAGAIALVSILAIMIILLAVLGLVVVKALAESPWGVFTVGATIPIAMLMGGYLRFWRVGRVLEASVLGALGLLLAVWGGKLVYDGFTVPPVIWQPLAWLHGRFSPDPLPTNSAALLTIKALPLAWGLILYGLAASILPVWLLLAPRDYLSTFMKLGTIFALALGILLVLPTVHMPVLTDFARNGLGPVVTGNLFPFCFITIACGAISGFHTLIASGTTPKLITREPHTRAVGYGAMCLESLVAIMAMIAATTMDPGVYFAMNMKGDPAAVVQSVNGYGFPLTAETMETMARQGGGHTLFARTGGAATLAVGMAQIFAKVVGQHWLDLWYHFAIMFEALFILTTLDAGTRVGRYILQDFLGNLYRPLGDTRSLKANLFASLLMVAGWGYFLIQGVLDPLGGINSLWPLFGIANQMLAAIALCLATTILLKMQLAAPRGRPALALITLVPLAWLLAVTLTAGAQKILHPDARIGFLAQARTLTAARPRLEAALETARSGGGEAAVGAAQKALDANRTLHFNNVLDAVVAGTFMVLVLIIILLSVREWILLLARKRLATLHETAPVWLPDYALAERKTHHLLGLLALAAGLLREWSGEADFERTRQRQAECACPAHPTEAARTRAYLDTLDDRYRSVRRCC